MASETVPHDIDDVPLLGEEQKHEQPPQTGSGRRSTSPALAAGVAYPAEPQPQVPQAQPQLYSGERAVGYGQPPVQYSAYPAPTPIGAQQQQSSTNVNVVTAQPPNLPTAPNPKPIPPPNPTLMVVTIIAAVMIFLFGMVTVWFCVFPAVIFAIVGYSLGDSPREDQRQTAKTMNWIAFGCNIAGLVTFIISVLIMIICIIVFAVNVNNGRYYY